MKLSRQSSLLKSESLTEIYLLVGQKRVSVYVREADSFVFLEQKVLVHEGSSDEVWVTSLLGVLRALDLSNASIHLILPAFLFLNQTIELDPSFLGKEMQGVARAIQDDLGFDLKEHRWRAHAGQFAYISLIKEQLIERIESFFQDNALLLVSIYNSLDLVGLSSDMGAISLHCRDYGVDCCVHGRDRIHKSYLLLPENWMAFERLELLALLKAEYLQVLSAYELDAIKVQCCWLTVSTDEEEVVREAFAQILEINPKTRSESSWIMRVKECVNKRDLNFLSSQMEKHLWQLGLWRKFRCPLAWATFCMLILFFGFLGWKQVIERENVVLLEQLINVQRLDAEWDSKHLSLNRLKSEVETAAVLSYEQHRFFRRILKGLEDALSGLDGLYLHQFSLKQRDATGEQRMQQCLVFEIECSPEANNTFLDILIQRLNTAPWGAGVIHFNLKEDAGEGALFVSGELVLGEILP